MEVVVDRADRKILEILRRWGRLPVSDIARMINLTAAPVQRRIDRLHRLGIIRGYTAVIDEHRSGALEAFVEVRLGGSTETGEVADIVRRIAEAEEFHTLSGDPDVLIRLRVEDVDHLQRVVNSIRRTGKVAGTKTLIVMHGWNRSFDAAETLVDDPHEPEPGSE